MAKSITLEVAGPEHALLVVGSLTTSGLDVIDPQQAKECRQLMEERGLLHVQEHSHAQALLSAREVMQNAGIQTLSTDATVQQPSGQGTGKSFHR